MKAAINMNNYEAYWVDYLDGKLDPVSEETLFSFLEKNTDLAASLIDADDYKLPTIELNFPGKKKLKAENQIENLIIAKIENQISDEDNVFITQKINSDPGIATTFLLYQKTILKVDKSIVFANKKQLKKTIVIPWYTYVSTVAAAFAIVFVTAWIISGTKLTDNLGIKAQYSEISMPERIINTPTESIEKIQNQNFAQINIQNNSKNLDLAQPSEIIINELKVSVPEKMPIVSLILEDENIQNQAVIMEHRYNEDIEIAGLEYSMQYIRTPKQNKLKTVINKVVDFGKELDIAGRYERIKIAKDDLLFTSNN